MTHSTRSRAAWDARRATADGAFLARQLAGDTATVLDRVVQIASTPAPVDFHVDTAAAGIIREETSTPRSG